MKTYFDCIPCFVRQALEAGRFVTTDPKVHEQILREVLRAISEMDLKESPPRMGQRIHRLIRELTGNPDPYAEVKGRFNRLAMGMYRRLKRIARTAANPLETAVRLAIAGNIIDFGVRSTIDESHVDEAIEHALAAPFDGDVEAMNKAVREAHSVLYLADNAGEIVFDRLLIEQLPMDKITLAVKGSPVINDATREDAEAAGLTERVRVIDNGSDAPGTVLADCSETFRRQFEAADVILAKGQGNYETLSEVEADIFFILKTKCPVIAQHLDVPVGTLVLQRSAALAPRPTGEEDDARI